MGDEGGGRGWKSLRWATGAKSTGGDVISAGRGGKELGNPTGEFKSKPSLLRDSRRKEQGAGGRGDYGGCHARVLTSHTFSSHGNVTTLEDTLIPILQVGPLRPRMAQQLTQIGT